MPSARQHPRSARQPYLPCDVVARVVKPPAPASPNPEPGSMSSPGRPATAGGTLASSHSERSSLPEASASMHFTRMDWSSSGMPGRTSLLPPLPLQLALAAAQREARRGWRELPPSRCRLAAALARDCCPRHCSAGGPAGEASAGVGAAAARTPAMPAGATSMICCADAAHLRFSTRRALFSASLADSLCHSGAVHLPSAADE